MDREPRASRGTAFACLLFLSIFVAGCGESTPGVRELTGHHCRLVWTVAEGDFTLFGAKVFSLWGFDSDSGKPAFRLIEGTGYWMKPLISPDGTRVIYSDLSSEKPVVWITEFGSGKSSAFIEGMAACVRRDAATGHDWVYYRLDRQVDAEIWRCRLDDQSDRHLVYSLGPTDFDVLTFATVSGDASRMAAAFPEHDVGAVELPNGRWNKYATGCWPSMAPDLSYASWVFEGSHRVLNVFSADGTDSRHVDLGTAPGIGKGEAYFPRWSNDARFFVMTVGGMGSDSALICVGRFDEGFTRITGWSSVTPKRGAYFMPDLWVADAPTFAFKQEAMTPAIELPKWRDRWPVTHDGLLFLWQRWSNQNEAPHEQGWRTCRVDARGGARPGPHGVLSVAGGYFEGDSIAKKIVDECTATNQLTVEATITPTSAASYPDAPIISLVSEDGAMNFAIQQWGSTLRFRLRHTKGTGAHTDQAVSLGAFESGKRHHVVITYAPGEVIWWFNGERHRDDTFRGEFSNWQPATLRIGGATPWRGYVEGLAIYKKAVTADDATRKHRFYSDMLARDKAAPRAKIKAKLVAKPPPFDPKQLATYSRSLAVYEYEVVQVLDGHVADTRVAVSHWSILDKQPIVPIRNRKLAEVVEMLIEPFDDHAELVSEHRVQSESSELMSFWHDVTDD